MLHVLFVWHMEPVALFLGQALDAGFVMALVMMVSPHRGPSINDQQCGY